MTEINIKLNNNIDIVYFSMKLKAYVHILLCISMMAENMYGVERQYFCVDVDLLTTQRNADSVVEVDSLYNATFFSFFDDVIE